MDWEPVWSGGSEPEAEIVAGRLRADRIRVRVFPGSAPLRSTYGAGLGGSWVVAAHPSQAEAARQLLEARDGSGVLHAEDFADPVRTNLRQMRRAWRWILLAVGAGAVAYLYSMLVANR